MTIKLYRKISCLLVFLLFVGCSGSSNDDATVQGTVTIGGELAAFGTVQFHPVGDGPIAYGKIHEDGSYSLQVGQGDRSNVDHSKIASGEYITTVLVSLRPTTYESIKEGNSGPPKSGPRLSPEKYASSQTSDLRYTVEPGPNIIDIQIERAQPKEEDSEEDLSEEPLKEQPDREESQPESKSKPLPSDAGDSQ